MPWCMWGRYRHLEKVLEDLRRLLICQTLVILRIYLNPNKNNPIIEQPNNSNHSYVN
jgi:hypothetical protein